MNNNPDNNKNNNNGIDDILDILQKRKTQDIQNNSFSDYAPTRVDNQVVNSAKDNAEPKTQKSTAAASKKTSSSPDDNASQETSSGISLSDFDNIKSQKPIQQKSKKRKFRVPRYVKAIAYVIAVIAISILISVSVIYVANDTFAFVKPDREITVEIKEGATLGDVAKELHEKGVIEYPLVYRIYSKMRMDKKDYYTGEFVSGKHTLNSNLGYDKLIAKLAKSIYSTEVVRVTIPEGYTASQIIDLFIEKRVISESDKAAFIEKLNLAIYDYAFLKEFDEVKDENGKVESDRIYLLEGYLFPDTYDFYVGENHESVVRKLLNNFDKKFEETYYGKQDELNLTLNQIITLASMIEAEGNKAEDLYKISSVFHNRIRNKASFPFLNSDATTVYALLEIKERKDITSEEITKYDTPYNTYINKGLPPGPICNPGVEAIHAALFPDNTNYYYFYTASNGVTYFSETQEQHNNYIQKDKNGTLK